MTRPLRAITVVTLTAASLALTPLLAQPRDTVLKGEAAFGDWRADSPGTRRLIRPQDLPPADLARSARNFVREVRRTAAQKPIVPPGFEASLFASGLKGPRLIRVAPNGDVFVAESGAGRVIVLRAGDDGPPQSSVFAFALNGPFGLAFYPPGPNPEWLYVANTDSVVRFP